MLDDASRTRSFPALAGMTYLNTAAEGIPPTVVAEALAQYARDRQLGMDGRERAYRPALRPVAAPRRRVHLDDPRLLRE